MDVANARAEGIQVYGYIPTYFDETQYCGSGSGQTPCAHDEPACPGDVYPYYVHCGTEAGLGTGPRCGVGGERLCAPALGTFGTEIQETVDTEIQEYWDWYGITNIFFDDAQNSCSPGDVEQPDGPNLKLNPNTSSWYYQQLYAAVTNFPGKDSPGDPQGVPKVAGDVIFNSGSPPTGNCLMDDKYGPRVKVVTWESPSDAHGGYDSKNKFAFPSWMQYYPANDFINVFNSTHTKETTCLEMVTDLARSRENNIGWVYFTDGKIGVNGGPYNILPTYWDDEVNDVMNPPTPTTPTSTSCAPPSG
jgi:hypothetical protein